MNLDENQSGYILGRSCVDNLFIIQELIEKHISNNHEPFLAFVDLEKAYDSVAHSNLWKSMVDIEINERIVKALKDYTDNVAYVKIGNELSDPIEVTKGLVIYLFHSTPFSTAVIGLVWFGLVWFGLVWFGLV